MLSDSPKKGLSDGRMVAENTPVSKAGLVCILLGSPIISGLIRGLFVTTWLALVCRSCFMYCLAVVFLDVFGLK